MKPVLESLLPGESILLDRWFSRWCSGGQAAWIRRRRGRWTLTDQRLIARKGFISKSMVELPLGRIQDVTLNVHPLGCSFVLVSSAGGPLGTERIGPLSKKDAREFANVLSARIAGGFDLTAASTEPSPASTADELDHLATLRDRGVLTEAEFATEKARILQRR